MSVAPPETSTLATETVAAPAPVAPSPPAFGGKGQLKKLALRGSAFEIAGYGAAQVLRLASNMILSRLLFPRAFGLLALVNIFNQGLVMLSDVGIEPAVIQNERGDDERFLNTAWTIQVIRGFILWAIASLAAWPLALLYREPELTWLTIAGSAAVAITGFHSTSMYTLRRRLAVGKLQIIEIGSQVAGLVVMIPWAYFHPSPWALVGGAIAGAIFKMIASHAIAVGYHNKVEWDPEARRAITNFGKWILGSSAVFFISRQGDRLLLGRFLGVTELGIYSIAVFMSDSIGTGIARVITGVLYPVLSRVRLEGEDRLREVYYRFRLALDGLSLPALGVLTMLGPWVVHLLYDKRYAEAGWMLQAFSLRVAMSCVLTPCETCLSSMGHTRWGLFQNSARMVWVLIMLPVGWHFAGLRGVVWAVALSEVPLFIVLWPPFRRLRMLHLARELRGVGFYLAGLAVGWVMARILHA